jgi:antitoxin CptB
MDDRRKKLKFRAWRRGFRELDLILGAFADAHLKELSEERVDEFEALMLHANDQDVYAWIVGVARPPERFDTELLRLVRAFRYFTRHALGGSADQSANCE